MKEYLAALDRALSKLQNVKGSGERFVVQEPKILSEGKTTVFENYIAIVEKLNRDPDHLFKFLLKEMGTAGKLDGSRAIFQGKFNTGAISGLIDTYIREYVTCSECGRPDTHLIREERVLILRCDACGAHRPVAKRQAKVTIEEEPLKEGEIYDVVITSVGRRGDGIAKKDKYTVYVQGTKKGDSVKIKVRRISGSLAFADLIEKKNK